MQNQIIKQDLTDNTSDSFILINPSKQQMASFPKEESQMFTSKTQNFTGSRPSGNVNDPDNETENKDTIAFLERAKGEEGSNTDVTAVGGVNYNLFDGSLPGGTSGLQDAYRFKFDSINSSHTPTDYIGAVSISIPCFIDEAFADFKAYDFTTDSVADFFDVSDTVAKVKTMKVGCQALRIPQNKFNTILTDETAIIANNNSNIIKNFRKYYIIISPKYVRTSVGNVINRKHYDWFNMYQNGTLSYDSVNSLIQVIPDTKRRTVYECDKTDFTSLPWLFENSNGQSGRLYGSIVEVWDSSETTLKQVKVMNENDFHFLDSGTEMQFVLSPDNVGYDSPGEEVISGDVLRVYPRETYFNQLIIEVNYFDDSLQVSNLLTFMLNDAVRDLKAGIYEIYDNKGYTIDTAGNINGNVVQRYQIFSNDKIESRKRITK